MYTDLHLFMLHMQADFCFRSSKEWKASVWGRMSSAYHNINNNNNNNNNIIIIIIIIIIIPALEMSVKDNAFRYQTEP
jgi:hypothetical protein